MKEGNKYPELSKQGVFYETSHGFFFGALVVYGIFALLTFIFGIFIDEEPNYWILLWMPVMVVFQAFISALIVGGIVVFGHKIKPIKRN